MPKFQLEHPKIVEFSLIAYFRSSAIFYDSVFILLKGNLLKMKEIRSTEDGNTDPCAKTCKDMTRCTWYTTETVINSETKAESYRCLYFSDCTLSLETNSIHEEVSA